MVDYSDLERRYGLPQGFLAPTRKVESADGRNVYNPKSGAAGDFQFIPRTARAYGLTDPYDPAASADAAARLARDNMAALRRAGIENPTAADLYLAHQQGASGAVKLLRGADVPAQSLVGANAVNWNSGKPSMTGSQFADVVKSKFLNASGGPQSTPSEVAYAAPLESPALQQPQATAPVYSQDIGTSFQRLGNWAAPDWVSAPTQLTPEEAATQAAALKAQSASASEFGNAAKAFAALQAMGQERPQEMIRNDIVRGQFRPAPKMRGLL